jgi:hypothetical protein
MSAPLIAATYRCVPAERPASRIVVLRGGGGKGKGQRDRVRRTTDLQWRATDLGPQLFWALAVVLPIGLGFAGVAADRRRKQTDWVAAR